MPRRSTNQENENDISRETDAGAAGSAHRGRDEMASFEGFPPKVRTELERLKAERDEAVVARQRALADFVNYQRRAQENEVAARRDAVRGVVRSLLPVLDHFDLAVQNATGQITVEQLLAGVQMVRGELAKALGSHGMHVIEPRVGDDFEPRHHQAVLHEPSSDLEPGQVANVLQVGYEVDDVVLRPASVSVASAPGEEE